jgi:hypothetical protein
MPNRAEPDDVDRLFALLEPVPAPDDLAERALASLAACEARRRRRMLLVALPCYAVMLLLLMLVSFALGRAIAVHGAGAVLALVLADPATVRAAPEDLLLAVAEHVPWGLVIALVLAGYALARCLQLVVNILGAPRTGQLKTGARHG